MALLTNPTTPTEEIVSDETLLDLLVGLRAALAAGAFLAPQTLQRVLGIDPLLNPAAPYLLRLFGARDGYLAYDVLTSDDPYATARRHVVIDGLDTVAALAALAKGSLPTRAALSAAGVAGLATWIGWRVSAD